jgi:signal peptidase I
VTINEEKEVKVIRVVHVTAPFGERARRELAAWFWIILAFLFVYSAIGQARVIPSASMEDTLLIGDHLLMSRFGYDAGIPFTNWHVSLWRNPKRGQIIIFRSVEGLQQDLVKRVIGMPGDTVEVRDGAVWIDGKKLDEPYIKEPISLNSHWGPEKIKDACYFAMGDNRNDSYDSRYWGCVPRGNIIGVPVMIYLSIDAPAREGSSTTTAWDPGHISERFEAYGGAVIHPSRVRWKRLFHFF